MRDFGYWLLVTVTLVLLPLVACTSVPLPTACPQLSVVSMELRAKIASEVKALQADSAVGWVVQDWIGLRAQVRACGAVK